MKKKVAVLLTCLLVIFYSCRKEKEVEFHESGVYRPISQIISPIAAFTTDGQVDGNNISVNLTNLSVGGIQYTDYENFDPLRDTLITMDSIYLSPQGNAYIYPNIFNLPPKKVNRIKDSLFLSPGHPQAVVKFSPYSLNGVIVADSMEAERYGTQTGEFTGTGIVLFSYDIYLKYATTPAVVGTIDANYLDLNYLKDQLRGSDTLLYIKKETYFRKD